jgi:valyl-tRNA synthetase
LKEHLKGLQLKEKIDPYTREAIQALQQPACIVAPYPQVVREKDMNVTIETTFDTVEKVVYAIRNIRGEMKLPPTTASDVHIVGNGDDPNFQVIKDNLKMITALVRIHAIETHTKEPALDFSGTAVLDRLKIMIPLPEEMLQQEKIRLEKEQVRLTTALEKIQAQLANADFVSKAPEQLIEKQKSFQQQLKNELSQVSEKLGRLA